MRVIVGTTRHISRGEALVLDYNAHANTYFDEKMTEEDKKQWLRDRDDCVGPLVRVPWHLQAPHTFTACDFFSLGLVIDPSLFLLLISFFCTVVDIDGLILIITWAN